MFDQWWIDADVRAGKVDDLLSLFFTAEPIHEAKHQPEDPTGLRNGHCAMRYFRVEQDEIVIGTLDHFSLGESCFHSQSVPVRKETACRNPPGLDMPWNNFKTWVGRPVDRPIIKQFVYRPDIPVTVPVGHVAGGNRRHSINMEEYGLRTYYFFQKFGDAVFNKNIYQYRIVIVVHDDVNALAVVMHPLLIAGFDSSFENVSAKSV
jgi:hypothetical protein